MTLIHKGMGSVQFLLDSTEMHLLVQLVSLYPLTSTEGAELSKSLEGTHASESRQWLIESLKEHHEELRADLRSLLTDPARCRVENEVHQLDLTPVELDRLLQAVNDVRVGAWIKLGSPNDRQLEELEPLPSHRRWMVVLEVGAKFESVLLSALGSHG